MCVYKCSDLEYKLEADCLSEVDFVYLCVWAALGAFLARVSIC